MSSSYRKSSSTNEGFSRIEFNLSISILLSCYRLPISISLWSNCFWIASLSFNAFNLSSFAWSFSTKAYCNFFWSCSFSIDEIPVRPFKLFLLLLGSELSLDSTKSSFLLVKLLERGWRLRLVMSAKAICFVTEVALGLGRGTTLTDLLWFIFSLSSFVFLQVM